MQSGSRHHYPHSVAGSLSMGPEHLVIFGDPITFSCLNYVILKTLPLSKWSYSVLASKSNLFKTKEMKKPWVSSLGRNLKGHGIRWRLAETGRVPTEHAGQPCQSWCSTAGQGTRLHSQVWLCCHSLMPLPGPRHFLFLRVLLFLHFKYNWYGGSRNRKTQHWPRNYYK